MHLAVHTLPPQANGLSDKIIVYHARMEDVELPEKVWVWGGGCMRDCCVCSVCTCTLRAH
jgi:hypothetical protein